MTTSPNRRQQLIVWLSMLVSIMMYFVVIQAIEPPPAAPNPTLVRALFIAGVTMVVASFPLKSRLRAQALQQGRPDRAFTAGTVAMVMCESAALFGVVVHFLAGSAQYHWFLLVGLAGLMLHYPREEGSQSS